MVAGASRFFVVGAAALASLAVAAEATAQDRPAVAKPGMTAPRTGVMAPGTAVGGATVAELSVDDCRAMGGRVEVHDGCATVGGNEVGLKCTIGANASCIDEAKAD
jgi:hypothetical protein